MAAIVTRLGPLLDQAPHENDTIYRNGSSKEINAEIDVCSKIPSLTVNKKLHEIIEEGAKMRDNKDDDSEEIYEARVPQDRHMLLTQ